MNIDLRTLFIVLAITNSIQAGAIFLQYLLNKIYRGIGWWVLGFAAEAIGFILMLLGEFVSLDRISIISANALLVSGTIFIYIGIMRFLNKKENWRFVFWVSVAFLLSYFYFAYINDDIIIRSFVSSTAEAAVLLFTALSLFVNKPRSIAASANLVAVILLAHSCVFLPPAVVLLTASIDPIFNPTLMQTAIFLLQLIEGILLTFGLIIMVNQRSNADMTEAKNHFELIFNTSPDVSQITRLSDGLIFDVNEGFVAMSGFTRDEVIDKKSTEINLWKDPADRQKVVNELKHKGYCEDFEAIFQRKDGSQFFGLMSAKIITLQGQLYIMSVTRDVTERKQLLEKLEHSSLFSKLILDSAGEGILGLDLLGNHTFINRAAAKMLGYEVDELIGKPSHSTWHYKKPDGSQYPKEECPIYKALKDGSICRIDSEVFWKKDGTNFPVEYTSTPIQGEGKITGTVVVFNDITERWQAQEKIKQIAKEWQSTFDSIKDLVSIHDKNFKLVRVNKAYADIFQKTPQELAGKYCYEIAHKTSCPIDNCPHEKALKTKESTMSEIFEPSLGIYLEISCSPIFNQDGEVEGTIHIAKNSTERKQIKDALIESEERYRQLFTASRDAVMTLEPPSWTFTSGNPATIDMFNARDEAEFLSHTLWTLSPVLQPDGRSSNEKAIEMINTAMREGSNFYEWVHRRIDGKEFFATVLLSRVKQGGKTFLHALIRDVTERRQMEQKLEEIATHDYLTGLPNRVLLSDRFSVAAALAHRNKARLAIMSLDLDKFKFINDTLGHDAGDQVLKEVGNRLTRVTRASDTIARVGGDEFILVMLETRQREDATAIAKKILTSLLEPLSIDGHQLRLSTSIGIAMYPEDAEDLAMLTKKSDAAMYYSKGHGRNQFKFYGDGDVAISGDHKSATLI